MEGLEERVAELAARVQHVEDRNHELRKEVMRYQEAERGRDVIAIQSGHDVLRMIQEEEGNEVIFEAPHSDDELLRREVFMRYEDEERGGGRIDRSEGGDIELQTTQGKEPIRETKSCPEEALSRIDVLAESDRSGQEEEENVKKFRSRSSAFSLSPRMNGRPKLESDWSQTSMHYRTMIKRTAGKDRHKQKTAAPRQMSAEAQEQMGRNLVLRELIEACEAPSIYLVKASTVDAEEDQDPWTIIVSDLCLLCVFFLQVVFPLWFCANRVYRGNPTLLSPGFHAQRTHTSIRVKWLHNLMTDISASVLLVYLAFTTWNRGMLSTFRFLLRPDPTNKLRKPILALGFISSSLTKYLIIFSTYILFRFLPSPHEIILNAVALDFISAVDVTLVSGFQRHAGLRTLVASSRKQIAACADAQIETGAFVQLRDLSKMSLIQLLFCSTRGIISGTTYSWQQRYLEAFYRFNQHAFTFVCFALWILSATGGHIAHTHFMTILYFFDFRRSPPTRHNSEHTLANKTRTCSDHKSDICYLLPALIHISFTYLLIRSAWYLLKKKELIPRRYKGISHGVLSMRRRYVYTRRSLPRESLARAPATRFGYSFGFPAQNGNLPDLEKQGERQIALDLELRNYYDENIDQVQENGGFSPSQPTQSSTPIHSPG